MVNQSKRWEKNETKMLKKMYGSQPNSKIASLLKRTPKAIERKAAKMKLFKTKKYLRALGRKV